MLDIATLHYTTPKYKNISVYVVCCKQQQTTQTVISIKVQSAHYEHVTIIWA